MCSAGTYRYTTANAIFEGLLYVLSMFYFFPRSGVTNTPRGGVVNCAQVKFLGIPFRSQRTLDAHPSPLGIGVLSSSWGVAPPGSPTSPNVNGCVVQGPIGMPRPLQPRRTNKENHKSIKLGN